jgi:long-subunit acyl-CoA synthetase (AMP-forming)
LLQKEFVDQMEAVRREQERHVTILHRNFHNLQSSLESTQAAAANKVANHLTDNQTLLNEVNNLRQEVRLFFHDVLMAVCLR